MNVVRTRWEQLRGKVGGDSFRKREATISSGSERLNKQPRVTPSRFSLRKVHVSLSQSIGCGFYQGCSSAASLRDWNTTSVSRDIHEAHFGCSGMTSCWPALGFVDSSGSFPDEIPEYITWLSFAYTLNLPASFLAFCPVGETVNQMAH